MNDCLFVVGGPLPSWSPESFLGVFDVVAVGEGEETMVELVSAVENGPELADVKGLVYRIGNQQTSTPARGFIKNLDSLAFPSRELFDNQSYKKYYKNSFGYTTTSMITSRGCPFSCDFCSRPIFGADMRTRSVGNIVDEAAAIVDLGYERVGLPTTVLPLTAGTCWVYVAKWSPGAWMLAGNASPEWIQ